MPEDEDALMHSPAVQVLLLSRDVKALQAQVVEQSQRQQDQFNELKAEQKKQMEAFGEKLSILTAAWTTSSNLVKIARWLAALAGGFAAIYALFRK